MIDYLVQNLWLAWVLVGLVCLILEMMNGDFYIMCFAIGSFCASLVSVFTDSVVVQVIVFVVFTVLSIFDGDSWKAKSVDGTEIGRGNGVRVLWLDSIIATVERC